MIITRDGLSPEDTKAGRYQRALLRLYRQHQQQEDGLPTNGRFLFYEGLHAEDWPKHYPGARQPNLLGPGTRGRGARVARPRGGRPKAGSFDAAQV